MRERGREGGGRENPRESGRDWNLMLTLRHQDPVGRCLQSPMRTLHVCGTEPESAYSRSGEQVELSPYHQEMRLAV